jgi:hypothetical protein
MPAILPVLQAFLPYPIGSESQFEHDWTMWPEKICREIRVAMVNANILSLFLQSQPTGGSYTVEPVEGIALTRSAAHVAG